MEIEIEPVKDCEVSVLSEVSCKCFYDTFHAQNDDEDIKLFLEKSLNRNALLVELQQPENYFFFARIEGEIAGFLKLTDATPSSLSSEFTGLEIARIYVLDHKIGTGIGKRLIEFAFSFGRKLDKNIIWLGVWEHNIRAIDFYRKYGFERFGEHIFMVGKDAQTDWLMKKELTY